jgi:hypothetical protein
LVGSEKYDVKVADLQDGTYKILPPYGGRYQVRIRVQNADGMDSVSEARYITGKLTSCFCWVLRKSLWYKDISINIVDLFQAFLWFI